ncbi:hypothetical protein K432DRAFT_429471 [Lepidopterella palustris CBS 459.81]|uniref:Clr5 domain-containing protein n=1 Tax=Lepidopterella palustris CBS 459.81 TaxID=1314670 RepID=A0A8E2E0X5_9PEZI|nr:hypothetical protein K432DRAFT_429471 [Lepidopterella palustris CBS 459.81]
MDPSNPYGSSGTSHHAASQDRWEILKPVIERLYMAENTKLRDLVNVMKRDHGLDAFDHQYKYHFKKWNWKRNLSTKKKSVISAALQTRAAAGKASAVITHKGQPVDPKKIRRHIKDTARQELIVSRDSAAGRQVLFGRALPFGNRIFLNWNMPYGALRLSRNKAIDHLSPFGPAVTTPQSDIIVATPSTGAPSPNNAPSPISKALAKKIMSGWLYQFWFFAFKSAKTWGRGPRNWTADSLGFAKYQEALPISLPNTPSATFNETSHRPSHSESSNTWSNSINSRPKPSHLCRWVIHVPNECVQWEETEPTFLLQMDAQNPHDETSWTNWPTAWHQPPFQERLRDALEHNDFSTMKTDQLPVAVPQIVTAAKKSPNELLEEAFGFSIMTRNVELMDDLFGQIVVANVDISGLYPLHAATSYLDGSKSCCDLLEVLLSKSSFNARQACVNDLGHTIFDNLMIAILKSHTSVAPVAVDDALRNDVRFIGEEVDICGRWDADSDCVRLLLARGDPSIPFEWKHKFCHMSIQTICHCILVLFSSLSPLRLGTESGLYIKHCLQPQCGLKLQPQPLHTLVLTAFHLACSGCEDEDLFGMLACLLCLISCGADATRKANISIAALFRGDENIEHCTHGELTPAELAEQLLTLSSLTANWSKKIRVGWRVFCNILRQCLEQAEETFGDSDMEIERDEEELHDIDDDIIVNPEGPAPKYLYEDHDTQHTRPFRRNRNLAALWAAVQTEFLTYRRLKEGDAWISEYFNMESLLESLDNGGYLSIRLVEEHLMNTFCVCGVFDSYHPHRPTVKDVTHQYIANLDVWDRATYIAIREE